MPKHRLQRGDRHEDDAAVVGLVAEIPMTRRATGPAAVLSRIRVADRRAPSSGDRRGRAPRHARRRIASAALYQRPATCCVFIIGVAGRPQSFGVGACRPDRCCSATAGRRVRRRSTVIAVRPRRRAACRPPAGSRCRSGCRRTSRRVFATPEPSDSSASRSRRRARPGPRSRRCGACAARRRAARSGRCAAGRARGAARAIERALAADRRAGRLQRLVERQARGAPDRRQRRQRRRRRGRRPGWRATTGPRRRTRRRCRRTGARSSRRARLARHDPRARRRAPRRARRTAAPCAGRSRRMSRAAGADRLHRGDLAASARRSASSSCSRAAPAPRAARAA